RHAADVGDVLSSDENITCVLAKAASPAIRTHGVSTVPAKENPHVQLVLLRFEVSEEVAHSVQNEIQLIRIQFTDRRVQGDSVRLGRFLEIVEINPVAGF